ncbi:hypothetical protein BN128_1883 [Cronobacter sakazakii 696]|nr:hypothetical protein BN128_1883 [Cronobacter sakazakii 696]
MPVCLPNYLMIKVLIHCQCAVIGFNEPQHQVEARKLFAVQRSILGIASATFTHTGQVHQRHKPLTNLQPKAQWLTGTGSNIADWRYLTGKQCITQAGFPGSGFTHNANNWLVVC